MSGSPVPGSGLHLSRAIVVWLGLPAYNPASRFLDESRPSWLDLQRHETTGMRSSSTPAVATLAGRPGSGLRATADILAAVRRPGQSRLVGWARWCGSRARPTRPWPCGLRTETGVKRLFVAVRPLEKL